MPANVEIKARIPSIEALLPRARALPDVSAPPEHIFQDDTFFGAPSGRLKLRVFGDGTGELIAYERPDAEGPKVSDYAIAKVADPAALREVLARACGVRGRVIKDRTLVLAGQTRIHLDRVEGLGAFLELEVVLRDGQSAADGTAIARGLLAALGVPDDALVRGAYLDLLAARGEAAI